MSFPLALALVAPLLQTSEPAFVYERDPAGTWRVESAGRFLVDPEVVTVRFLPGVADLAALQAQLGPGADAQLQGLTTLRTNRLGIHDLRIAPGADPLEVVAALEASGLVAWAEENTIGVYTDVPNDANFGNQWSLNNTGQSGGTPGADVSAVQAWDIETGDPSVTIAIIDSGTQISHPDLNSNIWANTDEIPENGLDDDNNGYVDDTVGWDFASNDNDPETTGSHGTQVGGCVAARTGNGIGIAGLAGGSTGAPGCTMMPCAVGAFSPLGSVLDDAILYAAENGARVATMSLTVGSSKAIDAALDYAWNTAGVFVNNATGNGGGSVGYPSNNPDCVGIGGTTDDDAVWSSSNKGPEVWVVAPSVSIYTTTLTSSYTSTSGTSFASPRAAATAGLVFSMKPLYTNEEVKEILKDSAKDLGTPGFDNAAGWGRLDAAGALALANLRDCNGNGLYDPSEIALDPSLDLNGNLYIDACETLDGDVASISLSAGGTQTFSLDSGPSHAGAIYWMFGSTSGTTPGLAIELVTLPLVPDAYFEITKDNPSLPYFGNFLGLLDGSGQATASLIIGPGANPGLAGLELNHAYLVISGGSVVTASNPIQVDLVP